MGLRADHLDAARRGRRRRPVIVSAHIVGEKGDGVVGDQPVLEPGESYQYTSGAMLKTPVGTMTGSYGMVAEDGHAFKADIPIFSLAMPRTLH